MNSYYVAHKQSQVIPHLLFCIRSDVTCWKFFIFNFVLPFLGIFGFSLNQDFLDSTHQGTNQHISLSFDQWRRKTAHSKRCGKYAFFTFSHKKEKKIGKVFSLPPNALRAKRVGEFIYNMYGHGVLIGHTKNVKYNIFLLINHQHKHYF